MMKQGDRITKARVATLALVFVAVIASLAFDLGLGTPSSFGLGQFFLLCPLGGIEALLASKALVPVTLISLAVVFAFALLFGRAWCAWGCPAPRIRGFFKREPKAESVHDAATAPATAQRTCSAAREAKGLAASIRHLARDRRTWALGVVLVATLIAGIPLFCLVCPIGLTFATVLVVWRLFAAGDMTWSVVLIPLLLVVELVFLRKWCTRFCPMAGLMNLVSRFSKTWRPVIDESKCLETVNGAACSKCAIACEADINLRHPDFGERTLADCTRCRACVDACPAKAVSMPFLVKKGAGPQASTVVLADIDEKTAE